MDISSPEYNPPSPFGTPPDSPQVAFESKNTRKGTGFFDSDSECSEVVNKSVIARVNIHILTPVFSGTLKEIKFL